jgi:hypothetical protein
MPLLLALMEAPGIVAGILIARLALRGQTAPGRAPQGWGQLAREVLLGKSVLLLAGGIAIGAVAGPEALKPIDPLFFGLFKGLLALFLLEMGLVAGGRLADLKRAGPFLLAFGLLAPPCFAVLGALAGKLAGLSVGGTALLATLSGSASYIAAPTAMRIALPAANPALSIGVALGVSFPFNLVIGIPLYLSLARAIGG